MITTQTGTSFSVRNILFSQSFFLGNHATLDNTCEVITYYEKLPFDILFKSKRDPSCSYPIIESRKAYFTEQKKK